MADEGGEVFAWVRRRLEREWAKQREEIAARVFSEAKVQCDHEHQEFTGCSEVNPRFDRYSFAEEVWVALPCKEEGCTGRATWDGVHCPRHAGVTEPPVKRVTGSEIREALGKPTPFFNLAGIADHLFQASADITPASRGVCEAKVAAIGESLSDDELAYLYAVYLHEGRGLRYEACVARLKRVGWR